jgi:2,4-dichlorophenol 6-monooxygenase
MPDGSPPPSSAPCEYRPDAHPGARLPFSSPDRSFPNSTLGMVKPDGITLFTQDARWRDIANASAGDAGVQVSLVLFGDGGIDLGLMAADLLGIAQGGAVAVRPDGHVLWRSRNWISDARERLTDALRHCSCGHSSRAQC